MIFIISEDVNKTLYEELCKRGEVFLLPENKSLLLFESKHADMQVFDSDENTCFVSENVPNNLIDFLNGHSIKTIKVRINKPDYPDCVKLNVLKTKEGIVANVKTADENILKNYSKISKVSQGYTRCSACYIDKLNLIITGDKGIADACTRDGYNVYLADNAKVKLSGYPHGFIGGAMFYVDLLNVLFVNGNLREYDTDLYELLSKNVIIVDTEGPLIDIGSCIYFYKN